MCSQDFLRSMRFWNHFFPECLGTSSEHCRNRDRHQLLARENVPRFFGKFCSKLTLAIEFEAHKRVPWLSERRQVTRNLQSGLISIVKSIYFLHRDNIPSLLSLYFIQNSRCRWIEYKETNASNRDTTLSLFRICDFLTSASLFSRYYYRLASSELFPAATQVLPFVSECIHEFSDAQFP